MRFGTFPAFWSAVCERFSGASVEDIREVIDAYTHKMFRKGLPEGTMLGEALEIRAENGDQLALWLEPFRHAPPRYLAKWGPGGGR